MGRIMQFKKIKPRMIFWFYMAALLPMIIVCGIIYQQRVISIKTEAFHKLTAIRDLKVSQLNNWLEERKSDLTTISKDFEIRELASVFNHLETTKNDQAVISAKNVIVSFVETYSAYHEIFIINASTGIVEISTKKISEGLDMSKEPFFIEPLKTGNLYVQDIHYSRQTKRPAMYFSHPVRSRSSNGRKPFAVIVSQVDLERSLYSLLLERTGMGKTGETLIVNTDVMALNELRWFDRAPLKLKIAAKPAVLASQGNAGIIETTDYRDVEVLASYTYLPKTRWGFVAKQDLSEIYAPIRNMLVNTAIILLVAGLFAYILAHILALNFSQPVLEVAKVASQIQAGNLSARCKIEKDDEYGVLARSFNKMAESMETYKMTQKGLRSLDEILVTSTTVDDFGAQFIEKLLDATGSAFGVFYLFNPDKKRCEHIYSMGFDTESLKSLDQSVVHGAFDRTCTTQKTTYIHEISKDTVFTINTIAGKALPRCIVTIPILIKEQVSAIIALGSINDYSEAASGIIEQIRSGVGTALSNIISSEKTAIQARELEEKNLELQVNTHELQVMTDDLKRQNIELDYQSKEIEKADKLKSVFLSNMSHELRTPLNSVMALSSVLKMNAAEKLSSEEIEYLDVIERNGKRLLDLINDILDLSKIEAGHMDVALSFFSLETAIENIMDSLRPLAKDKALALHTEIASDLPKIQSDEKRIHQILLNLMGNGIKFTEKGEMAVLASRSDNNICVKVSDTGIGIAEQDLSSIFEEFKQVDGSTSRRHEGTGLGLAIAYKATLNLGGDLSVESQLGQGTTFTLTLPVTWQGHNNRAQTLYSQQPSEMIKERKTVLVVDDEPGALDLIAGYLFREGYNTMTATSGAEALRLAEEHQPFAITLDLIMPEMDGFEVLQRLKKNPKISAIPVIIVSVAEDHKTGLALGAVGHVTKPVIRDDLINEINKACVRPSLVMVTDDNDIDRQNIMQMITRENIAAIGTENGKVCIEKIREAIPDVLVLDLMMPELDGFGVLEILRSEPLTMTLPVIIVTAKDLTLKDKKTLNQHVVSVLCKSGLTSDILLEEIGNSLSQIEMQTKSEIIQPQRPGKRILVVEDNEAAMIQIKMILEREGYLVDMAHGGQEAQEFVGHTIPDGIILDLMMPDINGFDVLEKVRSTEETANIPVLILTAKDLTPDDFKRLSHNNIQQLVQKGDVEREGLLLKVKIMLGEQPQNTSACQPEIIEKPMIKHREKAFDPKTGISGETLPKILVIEDNPDNMFTIKAVLKDRYAIIEADDGEKGLKAAFQEMPDLILLDISLPGMDGYAVVKEIKADEKASRIPVIALTAHAMKGDRDKIIAAGCNDYLSKPIDPVKIVETIRIWLEQN
ncbi:response regulator [Desulfococcaceae bacterium HSG9]|nr:response regulator [Desulfococcaceae bacterium HSG9]